MAVVALIVLLSGCTAAATTRPPPADDVARTLANQPAPLLWTAATASHADALHCPRRARACVDVERGLAWIQSRGQVTYGPVPIATGTRNHPTPVGNFTVVWKARHWTSTEYGVPMPYASFFAAGGIAFHEGPLNKRSHGCVHLNRHAARVFFDRLPVDARVHVQ